jgi:hypothetical protein
MKEIVKFLNEKEFVISERKPSEKDPSALSIQDFFCEEKRVTIVELVDRYQVMVYDGKQIHRADLFDSLSVVKYLKGIL